MTRGSEHHANKGELSRNVGRSRLLTFRRPACVDGTALRSLNQMIWTGRSFFSYRVDVQVRFNLWPTPGLGVSDLHFYLFLAASCQFCNPRNPTFRCKKLNILLRGSRQLSKRSLFVRNLVPNQVSWWQSQIPAAARTQSGNRWEGARCRVGSVTSGTDFTDSKRGPSRAQAHRPMHDIVLDFQCFRERTIEFSILSCPLDLLATEIFVPRIKLLESAWARATWFQIQITMGYPWIFMHLNISYSTRPFFRSMFLSTEIHNAIIETLRVSNHV
jgi:hypothetical protein